MDSLTNSFSDHSIDNHSDQINDNDHHTLTNKEYEIIIKDFEERERKLQEQLNDLRQKEKSASEVSEKFRLLGDLTAEMLDLESLPDIYNYITNFLQENVPNSVILFNSIDENKGIVKLESISGIKNKLLQRILGIWGINPIGKEFKLINTHDKYFRSGKFVEFHGKLEEFAASDLPPLIARAIERMIGLDKICTIGIMKDTSLLAAIHFLSFNKNTPPNSHFIEAFVRQAGIVIQKKLVEKSLKESEEKYRNIFENVQDVYYETTLDGTILEVSPSIEKFTKGLYTRTELIGKSLYNYFKNSSELDYFLSQLKHEGRLNSYEISLLNKDGSYIQSLVNAEVAFDNNGLPYKLVGSINDISIRKEIENALRLSEQKYRDIFKNTPVGIGEEDFSDVKKRFDQLKTSGVTNLRTYLDSNPDELDYLASLVKILSINDESIKILGCATKESAIRSLNSFFITESMPVFKEEMIALDSGAGYFDCEIPVLTNKGKRLFKLTLAIPENSRNTLSQVLVSFLDITERSEATEKVYESEKRYRSLFDKMQEGFALHEIICDKDGEPIDYRFIEANPAFEKLTGLCADKIRGKTVMEILPNNEKFWIEKYGNVALTGESIQFENYSQAINKYFHVVAFSPSKNQFATMFSDITENKLAETKLIQTKESYFDVFNSVAEAIYILDGKTGRFIDVNKGAETMYVSNREDLIGKSPENVAAPGMNDLEKIWQNIRSTFATGEPSQFEFWAVRKNGEIYPKEVILNKGRYFGDDVIIATARDITESKQAQDQLIRQAKFRQLLIEISSAFINLPLEQIDSSINKTLEVMGTSAEVDRAYIFDFDDKTELCTNTYEWCNEDIEPQIDFLRNIPLSKEWIELFRNGQVIYIDDVLALPEGETKKALEPQGIKSLIAVPMIDNGICLGFVGFDSVKRYHKFSEVDQQILTVSAQLLVNIKFRIESEKTLIRAKEKAEESDRLKSAFLANMSHEIRTPLNSIIGFSELLSDSDFDQIQRTEFAKLINENGNSLLTILSDIMDISKIESGQIQIKKSKFVVGKLISEIHHDFSFKASQRGIDLKLKIDKSIEKTTLNSDENKIRQVINNLVSNALKFTQDGFIEMGFVLNANEVQFHVKDTGIGIPNEYHQHIFERFRQVDLSRTRKYGGNGLGLAISKSFVEILGGKIWVESNTTEGSTFYFTIPEE